MKLVKIFFALVALALVFIFCTENDSKVVVKFLDYTTPEIYLFLLLMTTFVLGMITASFANTVKIMQLKRQLRQLQPETDETVSSKVKKEKKKKSTDIASPVESKAPNADVSSPAAISSVAQSETVETSEISDAVYEEEQVSSESQPAELQTPDVIELPAEPTQADSDTSVDHDKQDKPQ